MRYVIAAAAALAAGPVFAQGDAELGMSLFQQNCRTCHVLKEGQHRLGPSLYGVVGREVGSAEGFQYSSSLASSTEVWDEEKLDAFLADPDGVYPGTKMLYAGMPNADNRAAVIEYIKSESEAGAEGSGS